MQHDAMRFVAFLSYPHRGIAQEHAPLLQRDIESQSLPPIDSQQAGRRRRLGRVFRDDTDLSAAPSLSEVLKSALADSEHLILLLTAETKASRWCDEEVRYFIEIGRRDRIIAVLLEGEPADAWPEAIAGPNEPLAIDARPRVGESERARRRRVAVKVAAALLHVDHDVLVDRQRRRQIARLRGWAIVASTLLIVLSALVVFALLQRAEAIDAKAQAQHNLSNFNLLGAVVRLEETLKKEADLYPPWPHKVEAMERWLREDAGGVLAMQPEIERAVLDLQAKALPATPEDQAADRRGHSRFAEWEMLGRRVASMRHAQSIRDGGFLSEPELTPEQQMMDAVALNALAWPRVAPKAEDRKVYGEEALALVASRLAVQKAVGDASEYQLLDTLAWALVANGQDAEARRRSAEALAKAPAKDKDAYAGYQRDLDVAIAGAGEDLAQAEVALSELTTAVNQRRSFRFALGSQKFLHDTLTDLLPKLRSLATKEKAAVEQRLAWAKRVESLSLHHPNAMHTWPEVRAAIASNPNYAGQLIELRDQDIIGLVPIGENPVTHLWEFYELRSAWDGKQDPRAIAIPAHEPDDGSIKVTGDTGIVFVLLPGGSFRMGAQGADTSSANFDSDADDWESPVVTVSLSAFLLARYELTQGQRR